MEGARRYGRHSIRALSFIGSGIVTWPGINDHRLAAIRVSHSARISNRICRGQIMRGLKRIHGLGTAIVCVSLIAGSARANGDSLQTTGEEILAGIAATGIGIGVVIGLSIHASHGLEGCTVAGPGAIELRQTNDKQTWVLLGDTASLKPGQHVRVSGKRRGKNDAGMRNFIVENVKKNLGPCS